MPTKVLVADDSVLMRLLISDILKADPGLQVLDTATDGRDLANKVMSLKPDVVVTDMNMGAYDGLYAVKRIMAERPTPILILSAVGNTDMSPIIEALELGAFDYLNKPAKNSSKIRDVDTQLISKVKAAAKANISVLQQNEKKSNNNTHTFSEDLNYDVIVIGASTGGPPAIEKVISTLPANLAVPVLIAQHMPENFVPSFVERLNRNYNFNVVMGRGDETVSKGKIIVAPGSRNMIIKRNEGGRVVVGFTSRTYKEFNYPSVNALMTSVAEVYGARTIGVLLTGMGRDGVDGMESIKKAGGYTIAQNKATCVVFGMPGAAAERGVVNQLVPIDEMGGFIVSCLS